MKLSNPSTASVQTGGSLRDHRIAIDNDLAGRAIPLAVYTLLVLSVLSNQFLVTSALLSPAAYSVCPGFRTLEVDVLRNISRFYNMRNFGECYLFFREKPEGLTLSAAGTEAEPVHDRAELFLEQVQELTRSATTECVRVGIMESVACEHKEALNRSSGGNRKEADVQAQSEQSAACKFLQALASESTRLINAWYTCRDAPLPLENYTILLDPVVLSCIETLRNAVNITKLTAVTSCSILRYSMSSGSSAVTQRPCMPNGLSVLDSLVVSFTYLGCATLAFQDAYIDMEKLEGLEEDFQSVYFTSSEWPQRNLTISEQSSLLMCHSLLPVDVSRLQEQNVSDKPSQTLPLCENTCHGIRNILDNVDQFLDFSKSSILGVLRYVSRSACDNVTSGPGECVDLNTTTLVAVRRNSSSTPPASFCLNFSCHYPLRLTPNIHHWDSEIRPEIKQHTDDSQYWFPELAIPFSQQPVCGFGCVSLTGGDDQAGRVFRTIFGVFGVSASLVAIAAYFLNRDKLQHTARRLNAYMNIAYVLGQGSDSLYAAFPSAAEKVACYPDGTLRLFEPNAAEGASLCVIFSAKYMFFTFIMYYFGMAVMQEWYLMVTQLGDLNNVDRFTRTEKKREIVYIVATVTLSSILTAIPLARRKVEGHPALGHCSVENKELFYILAIPFLFAAAWMVTCLGLALPKLWKIFKEVKTSSKDIVSLSSCIGLQHKSTLSAKGLVSLLKLLTLYMMVTVVGFFALAGIYVEAFAQEDDVLLQYHLNNLCMRSRCNKSSCKPIPEFNIGIYITHELYTACYAIIISLWAFHWKTYWQSHLPWVSSVRRIPTVLSLTSLKSVAKVESSDNIPDLTTNASKDVDDGAPIRNSNRVTFKLSASGEKM